MLLLKIIGGIFLGLLIVAVGIAAFFHLRTQHQPNQAVFLAGKVPAVLPDGLYAGSVDLPQTNWKGKKFNRTEQSGINLFESNGTLSESAPFMTSVGPGNVDSPLQTIKIDYNLQTNILPLRLVVDEIVEIAPKQYLGKLEVHLLPNLYVALGYFKLSQP